MRKVHTRYGHPSAESAPGLASDIETASMVRNAHTACSNEAPSCIWDNCHENRPRSVVWSSSSSSAPQLPLAPFEADADRLRRAAGGVPAGEAFRRPGHWYG